VELYSTKLWGSITLLIEPRSTNKRINAPMYNGNIVPATLKIKSMLLSNRIPSQKLVAFKKGLIIDLFFNRVSSLYQSLRAIEFPIEVEIFNHEPKGLLLKNCYSARSTLQQFIHLLHR